MKLCWAIGFEILCRCVAEFVTICVVNWPNLDQIDEYVFDDIERYLKLITMN